MIPELDKLHEECGVFGIWGADNAASFVALQAPGRVRAEAIVTTAGEVVGRHEGIHRFTVGQRRGPWPEAGGWWPAARSLSRCPCATRAYETKPGIQHLNASPSSPV